MVYYKVHLQENNYKFSKKAINDIAAKIYTKGIMDLIEWLENNDVNSPTMMNDHDLVYDSLKSVVRYLCVCYKITLDISTCYKILPLQYQRCSHLWMFVSRILLYS